MLQKKFLKGLFLNFFARLSFPKSVIGNPSCCRVGTMRYRRFRYNLTIKLKHVVRRTPKTFQLFSFSAFQLTKCKAFCSGQTLIEGLIVCMLVTALMFGLIQVCILVVNDMLYNEVSFSATRAVSVTKEKDIQKFSKQTVNKLLITSGLMSGLLFADIEQDSRNSDEEETKTTNWEGTILGENIVDHDGTNIKKYNVKINYKTRLMFYKLFGGNLFRQQSARARMIKSPDAEYYDKAYPDAKSFSNKKQ